MTKQILLALTAFILGSSVWAQDSTFYSEKGFKVSRMDSASFYYVHYKNPGDTNVVLVKKFTRKGVLYMEENYRNKMRHGKSIEYNNDGSKKSEIDYVNDKREGQHLGWWSNGQLKRQDHYVNDVWKEGRCFSSTGADTGYFVFHRAPSYPGGTDSLRRFLYRNVRFPKEVQQQGIEGTVRVGFVIDKDGSVIDIAVTNKVHEALDREALRVVQKMPKWEPGLVDGVAVKFKYILPVVFRVE